MAKQRKSFPLRIDPELFKAIQAMAEQEIRSVNAQIEFLLRDAVQRRGRATGEGEQGNQSERDTGEDPR